MKGTQHKANFKNPKDNFTKEIKEYYEQDCSSWDILQSCAFYENFQIMIDDSIKSNKLTRLETLWQALYFYGTNPNFAADVYTATEFGNLKTLLHVLWAYMNYNVMEDLQYLEYYKLKELAINNKHLEVFNFIVSLITAVSNGQIMPCNKKNIKNNVFGQEFYKCVKNIV